MPCFDRRSLVLGAAVAALLAGQSWLGATSQATPAPTYEMTDLGSIEGAPTWGQDLNASGLVLANAYPPVDETATDTVHGALTYAATAYLWRNGEITALGTLGDPSTDSADLNDAGQVVGPAATADGKTHAYLWQDGTMTDLGALGGPHCEAVRINERGQVVGLSTTEPGQEHGGPGTHALLWQDGEMTDLGTLGGAFSRANSINDAGQVVGAAQNADGLLRPFLWEDGSMTDLGSLPDYGGGRAARINASGQITGYAEVAGGVVAVSDSAGSRRGFLFANGVMTDLGMLPGFTISRASGINDLGQITGGAENAEESPTASPEAVESPPPAHAFLWENGVLSDLNDLIPPASGWKLQYANGIGNDESIVGSGLIDGEEHAYLLTPNG